MKLLILGSTGYHPNERRHTACLMLPEIGVVLDAGTGMFRVRDHLATRELDIFLTHAHLDHVFGLTFLFDVLYGKDIARTTVYAEADKLAAIRQHLFAELLFPVEPPCEFRALEGPVPLPRGGRLTYFPLAHPGGSIGFRLDWPGRSLAYVTDTLAQADADYIQHVRGVDVLVHECYFADEQADLALKTGHSHVTPVAQVARAAGVGRLVLVHLNPLVNADDPIGLATARAIFPASELGFDGAQIEF
ncbi:MAG: MBL fold metallo-hydrolase [Planctomycetia bacterium]|nr:MBL fold metallo-hydrolase [Planctomycetia bacterium]